MENAVLEYIKELAPKLDKQLSASFTRINIFNIVSLVKEKDKYVFVYDDQSRAQALRTLGRFASRPELSFTWYDAALVSQRIRQQNDYRQIRKNRLENI